MEEPEKGLKVGHDEKVGGETLEGSVDCGGQIQMEGLFSKEFVGEDGRCNGKDVMVEVLGSDVYIDGVCTRGSDAEPNVEVGCGDSVEGGEDLDDGLPGTWDERHNQEESNLNDCGAPEDGNDVTLETLDEQNNISNWHGDKTMEKEACIYDKVEFDDKLNSVGEQQMGSDEVEHNFNNTPEEMVGGTEVAIDKALFNSAETKVMGAVEENIHGESNLRQNVEVQVGVSEEVGLNGGQDNEDGFIEAEQRKTTDGKVIRRASMKPGNSEKEGEFSVSDLVWGKVRSHPWWPGQIFDPSDSSDKAMKHYKKDCHLVAYFGDRTFAWNEASQLKPFMTHFSSIEKQSTSESFHNAVDCALDEVSRRVECGLTCSCIPEDTYNTIKFQTVENTGIQREVRFRQVVDESLNLSSFSPNKLIECLKTLSELPTGGFDRLGLAITKAQLLAFHRFKGYTCLPELHYCEGLDSDTETSIDDKENLSEVIEHTTPVIKNDGQTGLGNSKNQSSSRRKRKHNLKDTMRLTNKERNMSELMGGTPDSPEGDYWSDVKVTDNPVSRGRPKKRKTIDLHDDDSGMQDGRKTISLAKVSNTPKQSFKIGDCIRRVASQLTGSPSILKSGDRSQKTDGSTDDFSGNGFDVSFPMFEEAQRSDVIVPTEYSSLDDLLSSLQWVAQEPRGEYSFLNATVSFFSDFRNSVVVVDDYGKEMLRSDNVDSKRKKPPIAGSSETFEFEDMSDTYWTDRVIDNGNEEPSALPAREQPAQPAAEEPAQPARRKRKKDFQSVPGEPEKPVQVNRRPYSRKQYSESNYVEAPEKPSGYIDENAPAELVMNFAELDSVPSESNLNKTFRRFGPLKESETEVDRVSSRARVVFKKCVDAEVALSSAEKFSIFGSVLVNYQLNYTPSALFKASSVASSQDQEMHLDLSNFDVNMI